MHLNITASGHVRVTEPKQPAGLDSPGGGA